MIPINLILVRHGETDANRKRRFQGHVDVPLNAIGKLQAERLAARFRTEDQIDTIVTSDLVRARQTAVPISTALSAGAVSVMSALREQSFGIFDGMSVQDIQQLHPQEWERWLRFEADQAPPAGETTRAFQARVLSALKAIAERQSPGNTVLVVTHGGVLDMVFRTATGLSLDGPRVAEIPNAGINRVRLHAPSDSAALWRLDIVAWGDVAHLGGLPAQPVYDQKRLAREAEKAEQTDDGAPSSPR
jgi:probable phosphoglycerate mutase